jgi:hypothetical protein
VSRRRRLPSRGRAGRGDRAIATGSKRQIAGLGAGALQLAADVDDEAAMATAIGNAAETFDF